MSRGLRVSAAAPGLYRWLVVACSGLGLFLIALDITVNVALPSITRAFDVRLQTIQWMIIIYLSTQAGLIVGAGSAADLFGLKRFFLMGLLCNTVAVTLIGLSPNLGFVFGLRVLQAVGSGMIGASAPALVGHAFPGKHRGRGLGFTNAAAALGSIAGTLGGGLLVDAFGWRAVFLGRFPFGFLALALSWLVLREPRRPESQSSFDLAGAVALFVGLVSFLVGLGLGGRSGWSSPLVLGLFAGSLASGALFLAIERRANWPVLALSLLRDPGFTGLIASSFLASVGSFVLWFIFPFYVDRVMGGSAATLGLLMGLLALANTLTSPVVGWLAERIGPRPLLTLGVLAQALGLFWMGTLSGGSTVADVVPRVLLLGIALGCSTTVQYIWMLSVVSRERFGTGSASLRLSWMMGAVTSTALASLFFTGRLAFHSDASGAQGVGGEALQLSAFVAAYQETIRVWAAIALAGAALSLLTWRRRLFGKRS